MRVLKRDNTYEDVSFDKVQKRISMLCKGLNVSADEIAQKVCSRIHDGVKTSTLDDEAARLCAQLITKHPDYGVVAARIAISNHHKKTSPSFSETINGLYNAKDVNGLHNPLVSKELYDIVEKHKNKINNIIDYERDYGYDFFGFKTLERSYLLKQDGRIVERPQHMIMRVALGIHGWDIKEAIETYDLMSKRFFTHATPTLFNAGTKCPQMSSCFKENTEVFTINRGIVNIQDIMIDDEVVTHTGKIQKVSQLHKNPLNNRDIYDITLPKTPIISVTNNHKFMAIQKGNKENKWISVEDLKIGDYIAIPNNNEGLSFDKIDIYESIKDIINDKTELTFDENKIYLKIRYNITGIQYNNKTIEGRHNCQSINRYISFDEDMAWFLGVWYGDGCITYGKNSKNISIPRNIQIVSCTENRDLIDKCIEIGNKQFGIKASVSCAKDQNLVQIVWNSKILAITFEKLFGKGFQGKKINEKMFRWNKTLLIPLLGGLISSDGCCSKKGIITLQMSNQIYMKTLYHLLRNNGLWVGYKKVKKPDDWKYTQPYLMTIPKIKELSKYIIKYYTDNRLKLIDQNSKSGHIITVNNTIYVRLSGKKISTTSTEYVYTIGVENDHSYNVEGLVCENCYLIAVEDSISGMYKTLGDCAQISKYAGGIGMHIHDIRPTGSYIRGTNGKSTGIVPMLRVYNAAGRHVNQCFRGDTVVYAETNYNGMTLKYMQDVVIGDKLITIDGTYKPVLQIAVKDVNENVLCIKSEWTHSQEGVYVTKEHQIYTLDTNNNIVEKSAGELTTDSYVGFPKMQKFGYFMDPKDTLFLHNIYWVKITKIEEVKYEGKVYDFNMEDNHNYLTDIGIVHNSGKRNGSIAVYLEPWHADIEVFLDLRKNSGNHEERCHDLFTALWIPDLFMKRVEQNGDWSLMCPDECPGLSVAYGDEFEKLYTGYEEAGKFRKKIKAQALFYNIMRSQIETGTPYMLYKDAVNKKSNQKNLGTIKSSNLCVAPETMILTQNGYYEIKTLNEQNVKVWNGHEFSDVIIKQTGTNQKLITIKFTNGTSIRCTEYHKFYIETGTRPADKSVVKIIEAKDLKLNMNIIRYNLPILNTTTETMEHPYTHGLFCAEGTYSKSDISMQHKCQFKKWNNTEFCKNHQNFKKEFVSNHKCCAMSYEDKPILYLYGEKKKLLPHVNYIYSIIENEKEDRISIYLDHNIKEKYYVPINGTIETKIKWFEGYADGDGCVIELDGIKNIQIASIELNFLKNVMYMLQTLGINSKITLNKKAGPRLMPSHNNGKYKEYNCKDIYRINIDSNSILHLKDLGFNPKRLNINNCRAPHHITNAFIKISAIEDNNEYDDTYCFNEPLRHTGIFNGIIAGNCSEITLYSDKDETAVCNLASIGLPTYLKYTEEGKPEFDFKELHRVTQVITRNINKVIDKNFYPTDETRRSNLRHRPIGLGIQGLADLYILMRYPYESAEASALNKKIFATIYHGALTSSMTISKKRTEMRNELAELLATPKKTATIQKRIDTINTYLNIIPEEENLKEFIGAYSSYVGSPAYHGQLQYDLWGITEPETVDGFLDWTKLKEDIKKWGLRNSTLLSPMPTASTSQILGFNESFEAISSQIFTRQTLAGEFTIINRYLVNDLMKLELWNVGMKDKILAGNGSIQHIKEIPEDIRTLYKTVWEIKQRNVIDQSADRGVYVCQTQSLNIFVEDPDFTKMTNIHMYGWKKGLKTGMYYLRTRSKAKISAYTLEPPTNSPVEVKKPTEEEILACSRANPEACIMCSG
jgi:ribonucleoside-diphosphate reductase alpha chain